MNPASGITLASFAAFALRHWKLLLAAYCAVTAINTMPTPNGSGPTGTWWYKWLFGMTHAAIAGLPRIIVSFFPALARFLPGYTASTEVKP